MNNKEKKTHSMKARGMISDVVVHVVLALLAIVWVIPVLWIALLSFSTQKGSYVTSFFPKGYTLHNYVRLFTDTQVLDFPQMFKNTFIIAVFSCLISTIFVLSVSYCMSRMRFKIRKTYVDGGLSSIANSRCDSFASGGSFDHSDAVCGEIIAAGPFASASSVCAAWQSSPDHYASIVSPNYSSMGIGCWFCSTEAGQYTYWVVTFQ